MSVEERDIWYLEAKIERLEEQLQHIENLFLRGSNSIQERINYLEDDVAELKKKETPQ